MEATTPLRQIKQRMGAKGINSKRMSIIVGISEQHLSQVINGHKEAFKTRVAIAKALECSYEDIWD